MEVKIAFSQENNAWLSQRRTIRPVCQQASKAGYLTLLFQFTQLHCTACQVRAGTRDTAGEEGGAPSFLGGGRPDVPEGPPGTLQPFDRRDRDSLEPRWFGTGKTSRAYPPSGGGVTGSRPRPALGWALAGWGRAAWVLAKS